MEFYTIMRNQGKLEFDRSIQELSLFLYDALLSWHAMLLLLAAILIDRRLIIV
jgi:hypothetical protein